MAFFRKIKNKTFSISYKMLLSAFEWAEQKGLREECAKDLKPVFIIGAPRSGSTLLYQCMTTYFDVAYFSNLHCFLNTNPGFVEKYFKPFFKPHRENFESDHGAVKGWMAPSECGYYWYRFFRRNPQYVSLQDIESESMKKMQHSFSKFMHAAKKPVLIKNMNIALRLEPILEIFPNALFIVMKRDGLENIRSLLKARKTIRGDYNKWWSMEPSNIEDIKRKTCPVEQVDDQIRSIYEDIERSRSLKPGQFVEVVYKDLCENPVNELQKIHKFFEEHNVSCDLKDNIPNSFAKENKPLSDHVLEAKISSLREKYAA